LRTVVGDGDLVNLVRVAFLIEKKRDSAMDLGRTLLDGLKVETITYSPRHERYPDP